MPRPTILAALLLLLIISPLPATTAPDQPAPLEHALSVTGIPATTHTYFPATLQGEPVKVELTFLGEAELTFYCGCRQCCGKWAGYPTASGTTPHQGRTVAIDPELVPYGALVYIDGVVYTNEDKPAEWAMELADGILVDVYMSSHEECLQMGRQRALLWLVDSMM